MKPSEDININCCGALADKAELIRKCELYEEMVMDFAQKLDRVESSYNGSPSHTNVGKVKSLFNDE